ncbi:cbb3-type cytochrome c oxidase N-terminal domain-containing protein [uncultured Dokdonia sp.]|uniref:cbb3-type cytochrome c oxidase N-terminal domain-containing protein n=1 Tax=uncultured Dokdonia sp. TaxID=575653 RepID=UPI00260CB8DB|nr:cbb3-type cytochrome c oxidase N-terminal domain-containing protein [uncultured Dokdonia sp.]
MRTTASFLRILGFSVFGYFFLDYVGTTGDTSIFIQNPWMWVLFGAIILFYIAGEVSVAALKGILYKTLSPEAKKRYDQKEAQEKAKQFRWIKEKYKNSLGSKALEEEHEIILDHNYDGIKELDNNLPPWWVYMFYATIVFAIIYLVRFEVFNEYDQAEEYEIAVAEANLEIEEWKKTAKDLVDINTVIFLADAADLKVGQSIFGENCIACHKVDGGGGIGPNLTDPNWILGGGIKNVFKTISEGGRDGKGMIAWKTELSPAEMAQVASYVLTLEGTTPAEPKAPEGDIWIDPDQPEEVILEIKEVIIDSTVVNITINK